MKKILFSKSLIAIAFLFLILTLISSVKGTTVQNSKFECSSTDFNCYENYYGNVVKIQGIKQAFDDLKVRYRGDSLAKQFCHPLTHAIGRAASEKFKTLGEAFTKGDNFCSSGYYHGVLEGIAGRLGRKNLLDSLNSICNDIRGKNVYSLDYYNCVHGLGHGLMAITDDELFESLDYCGRLKGSWEQLSCASGVYMENVIIDGLNHKTKYLKKDDPLYPCNASPEKYRGTCFLMQTSYMLKLNNYNFEKTFETCSKVEEIYRNDCYESLGRDVSGFTISNISEAQKICLLGKTQDQKLGCLVGAARDFMYYFHSDKEAKNLCSSLADLNLKTPCLKSVEQYYSQSFIPN